MGVHVTHEHLVLVVANQFTHVGQLQVARTPPEGQVHHHHHQGFRAFAKTHKDRPAPFGAWQGVIFDSRGFEAAEYAIAVLRQAPQVAVEFILSSLRCFGLSRPNLVGQVIRLKFCGRIAFVTEGQAPVTNGLEVGIAVA